MFMYIVFTKRFVCDTCVHMYIFISRLVGGLASEKVRWAESVHTFRQEELTLAGDVLLTSSYLSYVGCFGRSYRLDMLENKWMPFLNSLDVCMCMHTCTCVYMCAKCII